MQAPDLLEHPRRDPERRHDEGLVAGATSTGLMYIRPSAHKKLKDDISKFIAATAGALALPGAAGGCSD